MNPARISRARFKDSLDSRSPQQWLTRLPTPGVPVAQGARRSARQAGKDVQEQAASINSIEKTGVHSFVPVVCVQGAEVQLELDDEWQLDVLVVLIRDDDVGKSRDVLKLNSCEDCA